MPYLALIILKPELISMNFYLQVLDQELNMTRRANRPFVPQHHQDYYSLQRQVQDMEQPMETPRRP